MGSRSLRPRGAQAIWAVRGCTPSFLWQHGEGGGCTSRRHRWPYGGGRGRRREKESLYALSANSKATHSSSQVSMAGSLAMRLYASCGLAGSRSLCSPAPAPGHAASHRPAQPHKHMHARTHARTHSHTHTSLEILFLPHRNANQFSEQKFLQMCQCLKKFSFPLFPF